MRNTPAGRPRHRCCRKDDVPGDLAQAAASARAASGAGITIASRLDNAVAQRRPAFCLLQATLLYGLIADLRAEQRQSGWTARHRCVEVAAEDGAAVFNANPVAVYVSVSVSVSVSVCLSVCLSVFVPGQAPAPQAAGRNALQRTAAALTR